MPNIYVNAGSDGYVQLVNSTSWASCRGASVGGNATFSTGSINGISAAHRAQVASGRGGGTSYVISRTFWSFDTSGISVAPSSATFKIYGFSTSSSDVIALKSDYMFHDGEETTGGSVLDYSSITNGETPLGNSDGSGAGTFASTSVVEYSNEVSTWSTSGYNDFTLNSDALSDMASLDTFKIAVVNYDYDYLDIEPSGGTLVTSGIYLSNYTGTSRDSYIDYTAGTATTVTHNANFFGSNF